MKNVNKLQLKLVESEEIVFRRSNVQLDILPVQLLSDWSVWNC